METKPTGFFEEAPGVKSLTRVLVFALIVYGIFASAAILVAGLTKYVQCDGKESLVGIVIASASLLTSISTFAAGWKLIQKPMENKQQAETTA